MTIQTKANLSRDPLRIDYLSGPDRESEKWLTDWVEFAERMSLPSPALFRFARAGQEYVCAAEL
jgi:hypothetical protein